VSESLFPRVHSASASADSSQNQSAGGGGVVSPHSSASAAASDSAQTQHNQNTAAAALSSHLMREVLHRQHSKDPFSAAADSALFSPTTHSAGDNTTTTGSGPGPEVPSQLQGLLDAGAIGVGVTATGAAPSSFTAGSAAHLPSTAAPGAMVVATAAGSSGGGVLRCIARPCTLLFSYMWHKDIDAGLARRGLRLHPAELLRDEEGLCFASLPSAFFPFISFLLRSIFFEANMVCGFFLHSK
jgi:hypothetical protein